MLQKNSYKTILVGEDIMRGIIYKYTNTVNGKVYIGQTIREQSRKEEHVKDALDGSAFAFHAAIRKHGYDSFEYSILHIVESRNSAYVRLSLNQLEIQEISAHNSFGDGGYNMTPGGEGADNGAYVSQWANTEEGKRRILERSENMKQREPFVNRVCKNCGVEYKAKTSKSIFCSVKCRNEGYWKDGSHTDDYMEERVCEWCGKTFTTSKHGNSKCCSYSCGASLMHFKKKKASW